MNRSKGVSSTAGLVFDEATHKYQYNGQELISVTTWLSKYFVTEFNSIFASVNKVKKNKIEGGITDPMKLREYWRLAGKRASEIGSATHSFVQMYHLDNTSRAKNGYEIAAIKAYKWICEEFDIIDIEKMVYSMEYLLAGQIDLVLKRKSNGEIVLADWKTTEDMLKSYGKLKNELKKYDASALNKYSIQLELYDIIGKIGASHNNRLLIQLKEDGMYEVYDSKSANNIQDFSKEIKAALEGRKAEIMHNQLQNI